MVVIIQTKDTDCQIGLKKKYNLLIASTKCTSLAIIDPVLGVRIENDISNKERQKASGLSLL